MIPARPICARLHTRPDVDDARLDGRARGGDPRHSLSWAIDRLVLGLVLLSGVTATAFSRRVLLGDLMFVAAGTLWAGFGIVLRRHRLDPLLATAVIAFSALLTYVPCYLLLGGGQRLIQLTPSVLATEVLVQGLIAGAGTLYTYAKMVSILGAARAAVFPALAPGLAALMAWPVLGQLPTLFEAGGLVIAMAGLFIAVTQSRRSTQIKVN